VDLQGAEGPVLQRLLDDNLLNLIDVLTVVYYHNQTLYDGISLIERVRQNRREHSGVSMAQELFH